MAQRNKIASNETSLLYAVEASLGVLPGTDGDAAIWKTAEPNSYSDFGGSTSLVARQPINQDRQRKKGKVVDISAAAGYTHDYTRYNSEDQLESFMFAATRRKTNAAVTAVSGASYTVADGTVFAAGHLVYASGFSTAANNGLKLVTAVGATTVSVAGLTAEASPPAAAKIALVGIQLDADDMAITNPTTLPVLTQSTFDLTTLGLVAGQWVFVGGDTTATKMGTAGNNGFKRIKSISATALVVDLTETAMSAETLSGGETLQIFFGDFLKNEKGSLVVTKSLQFERQLGAPDDGSTDLQAEYVKGCVGNTLTINYPEAGLITFDMGFTPLSTELIAAGDTLKSDAGASLVETTEGEGYSTTSDLKAAVLYGCDASKAYNPALFAYATEAKVNINNNVSVDKALSVVGGFDVTPGTFDVGGEIEAYFVTVEAVQAVQNNDDIGFYMAMFVDNAGIVIDMPLVALSGGRPDIALNEPVKLPLEKQAATGKKFGAYLDFTLGLTVFNYLPTLANT